MGFVYRGLVLGDWGCFSGEAMFWRGSEKEIKEQNGGPPCGQVRVLVVGDSGTSLTKKLCF